MIENQPNELTLIYHSDKAEDKKARAFIETIIGYAVKTLDLKRDKITETQLAEVANKMEVDIQMLFDPTYKDRFKTTNAHTITNASDADLLIILSREPILINTPITIIGKRAFRYSSANEVMIKNLTSDKIASVLSANVEEKKIVF